MTLYPLDAAVPVGFGLTPVDEAAGLVGFPLDAGPYGGGAGMEVVGPAGGVDLDSGTYGGGAGADDETTTGADDDQTLDSGTYGGGAGAEDDLTTGAEDETTGADELFGPYPGTDEVITGAELLDCGPYGTTGLDSGPYG